MICKNLNKKIPKMEKTMSQAKLKVIENNKWIKKIGINH